MRTVALLLLLLLAAAATGHTDTDRDPFLLTALVFTVCTIHADDVDFGTYSGIELRGTSRWRVLCSTRETPLTLRYDSGQNGTGRTKQAMVNHNGDKLEYRFDGVTGRLITDGNGLATGAANFTLPARQVVPPGSYADTVTVTVDF